LRQGPVARHIARNPASGAFWEAHLRHRLLSGVAH
jgi:hypothetical protein